jgi:hypothetical protein
MAKNTNKIIAGALAVVGVFFIVRYFRKKPAEAQAPTTPAETGGGTSTPVANDRLPLKRGSRGKNVAAVQQWILKIDKNALPKFGADGVLGAETEAALEKILGKKTIDSNADIDRLMLIYNQKTFPLVFPKEQPKNQFPTIPNLFPKK